MKDALRWWFDTNSFAGAARCLLTGAALWGALLWAMA